MDPDVLVALGRPKGYRGSYQSWKEGGIQPQIVFEIRSPNNSDTEMAEKLVDYDRFGVEEYYHYDPHRHIFEVFIRQNGHLQLFPVVGSFDSPRLGIRFLLRTTELQVLDPAGQPFRSLAEERARRMAAEAMIQAEWAKAQAEHDRAERLAARLRALGLEE